MRSFVAAVLVVLGSLCLALSVPVMWSHAMATDSERFVAAMTPLSSDRGVQALISDEVTSQIVARLDLSVLDNLPLPPALVGLGESARSAARTLVHQTVDRYVSSQAFTELWPVMLRSAHDGVAESLRGDTNGLVTLDVSPVVEQVKAQLVSAGLVVAQRLPVANVVVRAEVGRIEALRPYAQSADQASVLLPAAGTVLVLLGVAVATRRLLTLALTALLTGVGLGVFWWATDAASSYAVTRVVPGILPSSSRQAVYDLLAADLVDWLVVGVLASGVVLVLALVLGALARARRLTA